MTRYRIKTVPGQIAYLEIVSDVGDEYHVRITRHYEGYETSEDQTMTKQLFDLCVRTAYLEESPVDSVTPAGFEIAVNAAS